MKSIYLKYLGVLALNSLLIACAGIPMLLKTDQYCKAEVCNDIAVTRSYPKLEFSEQTEVVKTPVFKLQVPINGTIHKSTLTKKQIVYPNHTGLLVEQVEEKDFMLDIPKAFSKSRFKVSDYPAIMFLNRLQQPEPADYYDRYIWRLALANKGNYFNSGRFYISKMNDFNLYHAEVQVGPITDMVFITVKDAPDVLLKIYNYGLDKEVFNKVLASVVSIPVRGGF
ncbi:hypothetical protein H0A36_09450 [Endozoicomonas sp. SM1973]|uniref:Lipoprotein n=1 Tax=Spartinivicinus marinus TaxID=2994442 RepID=A0A853IFF4_9GAMM|nr:hypothetical protein [Spartinivicinus marinus]MCX4028088.1 hypothetical protein [Spartinivicinus marinus]NYZ66236.1 hypothetical protein [Spartinivicinus marinus]